MDYAGGNAVLPVLHEGLEIVLSHFKAWNTTLRGDFLWQVVEIVIRGIPTVLDYHFVGMFMSLCRSHFEGSVSTNLSNQIRREVDLWKFEVCI
jgi:hypothetical protein